MFKLFTTPAVTSEAQTQLEVNQSIFATQPQPEPVGSVLPSAYACKSDYVRAMFAKSGYPMSAERAIVGWGYGSRGWGWHVTMLARYAYECDITLFFAEPENAFCFASLRNPTPAPSQSTEPEVNPSPIVKSKIASLYGEPVIFGDNPITEPEPVNLDRLPFDSNAPMPMAKSKPIQWGLVREVNQTLEYWQSELKNALGENNPSRVNLCNQWIKSLSNVLLYIVFTL